MLVFPCGDLMQLFKIVSEGSKNPQTEKLKALVNCGERCVLRSLFTNTTSKALGLKFEYYSSTTEWFAKKRKHPIAPLSQKLRGGNNTNKITDGDHALNFGKEIQKTG